MKASSSNHKVPLWQCRRGPWRNSGGQVLNDIITNSNTGLNLKKTGFIFNVKAGSNMYCLAGIVNLKNDLGIAGSTDMKDVS
jgi:hypothetical protein